MFSGADHPGEAWEAGANAKTNAAASMITAASNKHLSANFFVPALLKRSSPLMIQPPFPAFTLFRES